MVSAARVGTTAQPKCQNPPFKIIPGSTLPQVGRPHHQPSATHALPLPAPRRFLIHQPQTKIRYGGRTVARLNVLRAEVRCVPLTGAAPNHEPSPLQNLMLSPRPWRQKACWILLVLPRRARNRAGCRCPIAPDELCEYAI